MRDRGRMAGTQAEGEAGSLQGAWCRTQSQGPGIMTWAKGRHSTTEPPREPFFFFFFMIITERERERGIDIGRERSRLHAPGARCGIRSRVSRIAPWARGRRQTAAPPRDPIVQLSYSNYAICIFLGFFKIHKFLFKYKW